MVSYAGAQECPPLVKQIDVLNAAIADLATAVAANGLITGITINYLVGTAQTTFNFQGYTLSDADSQAIFNDIKNILANDVNIVTNELGAIS